MTNLLNSTIWSPVQPKTLLVKVIGPQAQHSGWSNLYLLLENGSVFKIANRLVKNMVQAHSMFSAVLVWHRIIDDSLNRALLDAYTNSPSWATFNTTSGLLEGTPGNDDVCDTRQIRHTL